MAGRVRMSPCSSSSTTKRAAKTACCMATSRIGSLPVGDRRCGSQWVGQRHWNMESIYEYGARAGFWRLHRLFTEANVPSPSMASPPPCPLARPGRGDAGSRLGNRLARAEMDRLPRSQRRADERRDLEAAIRLHTRSPASARPAGIPAAPRSTRSIWPRKKAALTMCPTPMTTNCPTGFEHDGGNAPRSWSSPTRSTPTTCALPRRRASTRATSSLLSEGQFDTLYAEGQNGAAAHDEYRPALPPRRTAGTGRRRLRGSSTM
jgi:hypothetical protein